MEAENGVGRRSSVQAALPLVPTELNPSGWDFPAWAIVAPVAQSPGGRDDPARVKKLAWDSASLLTPSGTDAKVDRLCLLTLHPA